MRVLGGGKCQNDPYIPVLMVSFTEPGILEKWLPCEDK